MHRVSTRLLNHLAVSANLFFSQMREYGLRVVMEQKAGIMVQPTVHRAESFALISVLHFWELSRSLSQVLVSQECLVSPDEQHGA